MVSRQLMTAEQAADYLNRTPNWLAKQRCYGCGPVFVKLGRRILYDPNDLEDWVDRQKRSSTSDLGRIVDGLTATDR